MQQDEPKPDRFDILLRVGGFVLVGFLMYFVASGAMARLDDIFRSTLSVFAAGFAANWFCVRKFEHGRASDCGLPWPPRNLAAGFALGALALGTLVAGAEGAGLAAFEISSADYSFPLLALLLSFGVLGEEMFFRGYAFQYLVREWNATFTVLGSGLIFGLAHLLNQNVQLLGAVNTAIWGCLFGYAYIRSGSLWLPTGIHYGWNLALALSTSNLSGTTIRAADWNLRWSASDLWSGGSYGLEGGLLATFVAVPVFLIVRRVR